VTNDWFVYGRPLARTKDEEHAMSHKLNSAIAVIGIDIGKNSFHVVGHDKRGAITHHLSRKLQKLGHDARLMPATAIGTGEAFSKGRDFGAWLGLVPKQISTGDRTILGSISKRGNRYLRALFVQAAWVVLVRVGPKHWQRYGLKSWIEAAKRRLHHNVLAIGLANKLARIAWSVLAHGRTFEASKIKAA
jgi:transposase